MSTTLTELKIREQLFRHQVAVAFRVPEHVAQRRDARLREMAQDLPEGHRFGPLMGFSPSDWLGQAEGAIDECANCLTLHAQFASCDRKLEAEILRRLSELTALLEALQSPAEPAAALVDAPAEMSQQVSAGTRIAA